MIKQKELLFAIPIESDKNFRTFVLVSTILAL